MTPEQLAERLDRIDANVAKLTTGMTNLARRIGTAFSEVDDDLKALGDGLVELVNSIDSPVVVNVHANPPPELGTFLPAELNTFEPNQTDTPEDGLARYLPEVAG